MEVITHFKNCDIASEHKMKRVTLIMKNKSRHTGF